MDKQNVPETNLPAGHLPQYPSAAFQGPPGNTGYPGPQAGYPGPQDGLPGPQAGYPGPQAGFPGPQAGYSVPPADYPGAGPGGFAAHQQPVYNQPGRPAGIPWMPTPPPPSNCPPGLEYLSQIDQILIHQQIELLEVLTGFETNNKYEIKNSFGQRIYFAKEDTDCCTRYCCGASRPFNLKILDNIGQEVITMQRPLRCSSCCFPCCLQELEVHAPPGVPIGYVMQIWHPCLPKFTVQNERREDVLKIIGPCLVCSCCADIDFEEEGNALVYLTSVGEVVIALISIDVGYAKWKKEKQSLVVNKYKQNIEHLNMVVSVHYPCKVRHEACRLNLIAGARGSFLVRSTGGQLSVLFRGSDTFQFLQEAQLCKESFQEDSVKSLDERNVVGKITKQWGGFVREAYTDADNFGIQFPLDLDVKVKATMLGACFLIDFMFFETSGRNE